LSGTVVGLGAQVKDFFLGQSVLGTGHQLLREMVTLPASMVAPIPEGLDWERAACLPVAGQTAWTAIESQNVHPGETAVVSAAAGGVGQFICQILRHQGVNVIGTASVRNHPHLRSMGIVPIHYGPGLADRLKKIIPSSGIHHVFDQSGAEMLEAALELGVPRSQINSVSGLGPTYGVPSLGRVGLDRDVVNLLGRAITGGEINLQIKSFPLELVVEAFVELENPSGIGKVVMKLMPNQDR
jgi:NADPH:quinone reductase-like Zn-dependent oxidoreductase